MTESKWSTNGLVLDSKRGAVREREGLEQALKNREKMIQCQYGISIVTGTQRL